MRQAPFFGWIHDLSQMDPTNVFNLFGLLPWDPAAYFAAAASGRLAADHGAHDVPAAADEPAAAGPGQAKLFQFMPMIFTFMMASSRPG